MRFAHNDPALRHNNPAQRHKLLDLAHRYPELRHLSGIGNLILLSALSVAEDAEVGTIIAALSVGRNGDFIFTIVADPDSKFEITGGNDLRLADTLDFETASTHSVTIEADDGVDDPIVNTFTISVTDVEE